MLERLYDKRGEGALARAIPTLSAPIIPHDTHYCVYIFNVGGNSMRVPPYTRAPYRLAPARGTGVQPWAWSASTASRASTNP